MGARYFEADKGRFDSMLVRDDGTQKVAIAYTSGETVKLYAAYCTADKKAVNDFAETYDFPVDWESRR